MHSLKKKPTGTVREPKIEAAVKKYLAGDAKAFNEIYAYLSPVINQVLHTKKYPGYMDHIEDIRQECWVDAVKNVRLWDPERGTLKNFMFKCFANKTMVYLHRVDSTRVFVPMEEIAETVPSAGYNTLIQDLDIALPSRFSEFKEQFIIRRVCVLVYLRIFDGSRNKIMRELREWTGYSTRRVRFLIDYSLVLVRNYCLEVGWRLEKLLDVNYGT